MTPSPRLRARPAESMGHRGTNPRAIQQVMGHRSLETTMGYFHAEALSVCSPLDANPVILPDLDKAPFSAARPKVATEAQRTSQDFGTSVDRAQPTLAPQSRADNRERGCAQINGKRPTRTVLKIGPALPRQPIFRAKSPATALPGAASWQAPFAAVDHP